MMTKSRKNIGNKESTSSHQKWYQHLWVKVVGGLTFIALIAAILSDGGQVYDRFKSKKQNKLMPSDTTYKLDSIINIPDINPSNTSNKLAVRFNSKSFLDSLKLADTYYLEFNHNEYAFRSYKRLYESLPLELKAIIDKKEIQKASDKIDAKKDREAAGIMKKELDKVKIQITN